MTSQRQHRPAAAARRAALLRAAVEVAADVGIAGITHRAVTERAGLPLATVSYFFASIDDLVEEALRVVTDGDAVQQIALAHHLEDQRSTPDEIAMTFAALAAPHWPDTPALIEVLLHAARHPELRPAAGRALDVMRGVASAAAGAAGHPEPDSVAAALTALTHGFALHQMAAPDRVGPDAFPQALRAFVLGSLLAAGHTELALELAAGSPR